MPNGDHSLPLSQMDRQIKQRNRIYLPMDSPQQQTPVPLSTTTSIPRPRSISRTNSSLLHALNAFDTPAPPPAWAESDFTGKIAFLRCTQDQALPLSLQGIFTEKSGVDWRIEDIDAFHSPWASRPEETIGIREKWDQGFEDGG